MKLFITISLLILTFAIPISSANAKSKYYAHKYCNKPDYHCIKTKKGDTWEKLFTHSNQREVVKRLNRMNIQLRPGLKIAVPNNLSRTNLNDINPLPKYAEVSRPTVIVDKSDYAWGAYNSRGNLVKWGPVSLGKNYCKDTNSKCTTILGEYKVTRKKGKGCVSHTFPLGKGGAPMPYCMFFHRGYAMHGSHKVPGYNDSHGCVRMFVNDAEWLSSEFVKTGETKVIIRK